MILLNKFDFTKLSAHRIFLLAFYATVGSSLLITIILIIFKHEEIEILSIDGLFFTLVSFLNVFYILLRYVIIPIIILFFLSKKMLFSPEFIDDFLVFKIREYKITFIWIIGIFFSIFVVIFFILLIALFFSNPENFVKTVKDFAFTWLFSLEISIAGIALVFAAKLQEPPKLQSSLADRITPKLMARDLDSAIRKAFACCEEKLKQKMKTESNNFGKNLIKEAFGNWNEKNVNRDEGLLKYKNDKTQYKQRDICDSMVGIFGMYRNPYMHGKCEEELTEQNSEKNLEEVIQENAEKSIKRQKLIAILTLIDEFVQIIDESELRSENTEADKADKKKGESENKADGQSSNKI